MHIPDGYLSPSTCVGLYAASAPFWYTALQRVQKTIDRKTVPLIALFAAFSFVIMMFNLPLPGGTTGHAVGVGIATIVLGPWVSMLAISIALLIQALFFGDGGITTFGANSFNMAVVGSLSAAAIYYLLAGGQAISTTRRVVAAALAGYGAINVAAFCAAVEFGIQPALFRDATGAPLYAPYPLSVAIPAMMIGHLTLAGLAEGMVTAGVVRYLLASYPELLQTARDARVQSQPRIARNVRRLWVGLGALVMLTPLGILAVGQAWGEWSVRDFLNSSTREQIASVSKTPLPVATAPHGLARLAGIWNAPVTGYSPRFIHGLSAGYLMSAVVGVTLILLLTLAASRWLLRSRRRKQGILERTVRDLLHLMEDSLFAESIARSKGLLQAIDARAKIAGLGALLLSAIVVRRLSVLCGLLIMGVVLALLSRVPLRILITRVWLSVLAFTGSIALPSLFLTSGRIVYDLPLVHWAVTAQGLRSAAFLILRAEAASTFALLLVLCTLWNHLLRSLRFFRIPAVVVLMVEMTYRYIFLLLQTAQNMFESRQTRIVGELTPGQQRHFIASAAGVLLEKTLQMSTGVLDAMHARGFRGEIVLIEDLRMASSDWARLTAFVTTAVLAIWLGR